MDAISLLLEASEFRAKDNSNALQALVEASEDIEKEDTDGSENEAVDVILHLRDSFGSYDDCFGLRDDRFAAGQTERRRRAMSEPWVTMSPSFKRGSELGFDHDRSSVSSVFNPALLQQRFPQPILGDVEQPFNSVPNRVPTIEEFQSICNRNGRIGIYTKEERAVLIRRFREKKKRRIWKKKIRYECRKDLADRRCRVKGRFVKASPSSANASDNVTMQASGSLSSDNTSEETSSLSGDMPLVLNISAGRSGPAAAPANPRKRKVKPLLLHTMTNPEDRLKYLSSILGGGVEEDNDNDEEEEEEEEEDEEDEEDEDSEGNGAADKKGDSGAMDIEKPLTMIISHRSAQARSYFPAPTASTETAGELVKPEGRYRTRSNSDVDYRRPRRHSIAY